MSLSAPTTIENPEFAIPFTFDMANGGTIMVEQDSETDLVNRIWIALSYEPGMLTALPEFGIPSQVFRTDGADLGLIEKAIVKYVPEASELVERDPNWFMSLIDTVQVRRDEVSSA